jgi:hypothetical protein
MSYHIVLVVTGLDHRSVERLRQRYQSLLRRQSPRVAVDKYLYFFDSGYKIPIISLDQPWPTENLRLSKLQEAGHLRIRIGLAEILAIVLTVLFHPPPLH